MTPASIALLLSTLAAAPGARAAAPEGLDCIRGDGRACSEVELADPVRYRQILVFPAGFTEAERALYEQGMKQLIRSCSAAGGGTYAGKYADRILYLSKWTPGGALG